MPKLLAEGSAPPACESKHVSIRSPETGLRSGGGESSPPARAGGSGAPEAELAELGPWAELSTGGSPKTMTRSEHALATSISAT